MQIQVPTGLPPVGQTESIPALLTALGARQIQLWVEEGRLRYRAPNTAMTAEIRAQLAARKGELLHFLQRVQTDQAEGEHIPRTDRSARLPLSYAQQRLWFLDQLEGPSATYNIGGAIRIRGALNITILEQGINALVARHESLRTTFPTVDGAPVQQIASMLTIPLRTLDLRHLSAAAREEAILQEARAERQQPFDLVQGPLLRMTLLRVQESATAPAENEAVLLSTIHHIIADGWSMGVFGQELVTLYSALAKGKASPLPPLPIQYADYALWQRQWLNDGALAEQSAYWHAQLGGALPVLNLPTDRPRPPQQTFQGRRHAFALPQPLTQALNALSQQEGVTLFMTLLAAFNVLLHWYSGQREIVVGTDVANRHRTEIEGLIGFFVNQLVLRTGLSGTPTFRELLARVKAVTLGAYAHQDLPFDKLVELLNPVRDPSRSPLFQVKLVLQNAPMPPLALAGLTWQPLDVEGAVAKFDLLLDLWEETGGLQGELEYNTDLFEAATIGRMVDYFTLVLTAVTAQPASSLAGLCTQLTNAAEAHRQQEEAHLRTTGLRKLQKRRKNHAGRSI
ncbi:MAG: condensation domain-containing protein [Caldilineaceae bacterium]